MMVNGFKNGARMFWPILGPILFVIVMTLGGALASRMQGQIDDGAKQQMETGKRLERVDSKLEYVEKTVGEIRTEQQTTNGQLTQIEILLRGAIGPTPRR